MLALLPVVGASAATIATQTHKTHSKSHKITESSTTQKKMRPDAAQHQKRSHP